MNADLRPLPRAFFARNTVDVARDLLGHFLVHETRQGRVVGRIVEVEAYRGPRDPASHAYRLTPRSRIMWSQPGTAYVYFTYGNHYCLNVVCEPEGTAGAVLFRALQPVEGLDVMRRARGVDAPDMLASGPGRLTQAVAVGPEHNGADLTRPPLYVAYGDPAGVRIRRSRRIGITAAAGRLWRFYADRSPFVSRR